MLVDVVDGHWCQVWKNKTNKLSLSSVNLCSNGNLESNKTDVEEWRRIRKGTPSGLQSRRWELNQQMTPLTSWRCRSSAPHHLCRCGPRAFAVAALSDHVQFCFVFFSISNLSPVPEDPSLSSRCFLISLVQNTSCLHPPHVAVGTLFFRALIWSGPICWPCSAHEARGTFPATDTVTIQARVASQVASDVISPSMSIIHLNCSSRPSKLLTSYHLHFISAYFCPSLHTLPFNCQCRS